METTKQLGRSREIRKVTPDGRVYILRRKGRPSTQETNNHNASEAKEKEVPR
jgi:hypothetical protein